MRNTASVLELFWLFSGLALPRRYEYVRVRLGDSSLNRTLGAANPLNAKGSRLPAIKLLARRRVGVGIQQVVHL